MVTSGSLTSPLAPSGHMQDNSCQAHPTHQRLATSHARPTGAELLGGTRQKVSLSETLEQWSEVGGK